MSPAQIVSAVVAVLALALAGLSYRRAGSAEDRAERAEERAELAEQRATAADHRARTPTLDVTAERDDGISDAVIYLVRIVDGPDLDRVRVHRPWTRDGVWYGVARTGEIGSVGTDFLDEVDLGPLPIDRVARFTLRVGTRTWQQFTVRVECQVGDETSWQSAHILELATPLVDNTW